MPVRKRNRTQYPGVYYVDSKSINSQEPERIYYIMYRRGGKLVEEKTGRQFKDNMSPSLSAAIRSEKIASAKMDSQKRVTWNTSSNIEEQKGEWTIDRLWNAYQEQLERSKSIPSDTSRYKRYIKDLFGRRKLKDLTGEDIDRFKKSLLRQKSPQTVKHTLGILNRLHNFAMKNDLAPGLSFVIPLPKVNNTKTEELNPEQINALLQAIDESEFPIAGAMMKTALYTGMKRSEMFELMWNDIDIEKRCISLQRPLNKEMKTIPINDAAMQVFKTLPRTSKYVFPGQGGKKRTTITREVNTIKEKAGLPQDFRPLQGLRHTYASMLAASGKVDIYTLQQLLNHKSPLMTQRYVRLRDEAMQKAASLAGDIINQVVADGQTNTAKKKIYETKEIDKYDMTRKAVKKNKKVEKKEKTAITSMKQLKIPGLG